MNCRSCDEYGLLHLVSKTDQASYVFSCTCPRGDKSRYPKWSNMIVGYDRMFTQKDLATAEKWFKDNGCSFKNMNLRAGNFLKDMDVSLEAREIKEYMKSSYRPCDLGDAGSSFEDTLF